ncbi:MAG: hypothetical protein ABFS09_03860 [Thermodesulfobacteriota bacterium]
MIGGGQPTDNHRKRRAGAGLNAGQINTGTTCHHDVRMVHRAMHDFDLSDVEMLIIENINNMACQTVYDLGENLGCRGQQP